MQSKLTPTIVANNDHIDAKLRYVDSLVDEKVEREKKSPSNANAKIDAGVPIQELLSGVIKTVVNPDDGINSNKD